MFLFCYKDKKGAEEVGDKSNNDLFALREKLVKESRVRRQTQGDFGSGSTPGKCRAKQFRSFLICKIKEGDIKYYIIVWTLPKRFYE